MDNKDSNSNRTLSLVNLGAGIPALTTNVGATMAEACVLCLEEQGHANGVKLKVLGTFSDIFNVLWQNIEVTEQLRRCWGDPDVAVEHAACGLAILLVRELTEFTAIERSRKGTGFDYWLGDKIPNEGLPFQSKARLEVSGIRNGTETLVKARAKRKLEQTTPSDNTALPAYIVIVEFSNPLSQMVKK